MAAAGKKVVIAPPAIKKPDIAIKKPLIPVTPAKKASGSKGSPLQQAAGGADGKPPPPKPVLVAKKGVGGTPASAAGETKATALKKPAVVSPPGKTATPKEGSKAPQKKPGQDTRKKDGKGGGAAAASKAVKKVYGGSPKEGGGGGAQQKRAKEEKKKSRDKGGGGFLSRLFGRRAEPDSDEDDESSDNKVKQVAPPPPRFENVKPRKMVGGAKPGAGGAGPPKFGTGEARKFQPLRKGAGLPGAPAGKSEEGHDMASKLKGPMPSVKEIPVKPDTKLAGKKSMSSKLPPANGPGPPPLKKAEGIAAGVPSRGEGGDKTEAGNDLDKALSPLPPKILPKIEPKKPIPTAPAKPLGIAPKKIDIVPKKLPSPKKEEEPEPAKKAAKPPSPPPPGEKKEAEGEGKRQGLVGKNLGGFPKKEASGDEPMGDGEKKEGGKKPSVFDRLMAKDKDAKGPAPKRTLADLLGKDTGKPSAAATGGGRADDDSLPGKVKNFLQKHPQHYPKSDDELRQDIPDSQLKIVQDGIGASEADAAALRKATKAAYGFELARRLVKDFGASNWGSRRQDLLEGKLGPEPVAKELARDNPKLAELRDWTALVQAYAAEGKALTAALDRLKTENSKAHTELLQAPFNDRDKFNSVAAPIVSKVKASEENAALDPAYLQEHLQDFAGKKRESVAGELLLHPRGNFGSRSVDRVLYGPYPSTHGGPKFSRKGT
ncbi:hypothetical protein CSUI_003493 [Cystoisospora suis]|uniref:Uncharacterized protein n=1 Tax=Cystoisospora suis TaxID=483139 RepID=A0A2C6L442_9APIC|nr:hypothetical protein CSUI_003493 [Cystoisospora suis]